jgi:hypothetical protein
MVSQKKPSKGMKFRKREQKLVERLEKARKTLARAERRLQKARGRVQRQLECVERLEARLARNHQQLKELNTAPGESSILLIEQGRAAKQNGVLVSEEVEGALLDAELLAIHAHAVSAANAEVEAEVAEEQGADKVYTEREKSYRAENMAHGKTEEIEDEDDEDTLKLPVVRPGKSQ